MDLEEAFETLAQGKQLTAMDLDRSVRTQLTEYGIQVREGVLSSQSSEFLDASVIAAQLHESTRTWLKRLDVLSCTQSTNTDLLDLSRDSDIDGRIRTAEVQTSGRGRRGRQWISPFAKNVALSVGIAVDRSTAEIGGVSLAIGLVVAQVLDDLQIEDVGLKWPNDILIDKRKVGGILIELADAQRPASLVVGVGINVHDAPGVQVTGNYRATRIVDHLASCSRNSLVAHLINKIYDAIRRFEDFGFDPFKEGWERRDVLRGKSVVLTGSEPPISGIGAGIDDEGAYLIKTATGVERAIGGELSLRITDR
ncbi:MAG: biotin--[acetyl-CoA-carboxylase] ligase [Gammaproteobacteria bacterium]|nr:biotin--[acetyl-CoA-carboxylase] ligase [Gammaproteobacteria bacterium]